MVVCTVDLFLLRGQEGAEGMRIKMAEHERVECRHCGAVIRQCRCMDKNKTITYAECGKCRGEEDD